MTSVVNSADNDGSEPGQISGGLRTTITMLLALHLFAFAVALLSNTASSGLIRQLRRTPMLFGYLQLLNMDSGYNVYWTHGSLVDVDHQFALDLKFADGRAETVTLPEPAMAPLARARRFQSLARVVARVEGDDNMEPVIPKSVAGGVLAASGAERCTIRCLGRGLVTREMALAGDVDPTDAQYLRPVYEGTAWIQDGTVQLLKTEQSAETAPAAAGPALPE